MTTATVVPIRREFQVHRFDPIKHGVLSKHIALPWEDREAFEEILRGLLVEHAPQGPTAYHLVEDLAGVIWRKRRLLQAEGAAIRERLFEVTRGYGHENASKYALAHNGEKFGGSVIDIVGGGIPSVDGIAREIEMIDSALAILAASRRGAYGKALAMLDQMTLEIWESEALDEKESEQCGYSQDSDGLTEFLEERREGAMACMGDFTNAPLVVDQVHGMAIDIRDLERIARIEAHLDAKMQRLLGLLRQTKEVLPKPPR